VIIRRGVDASTPLEARERFHHELLSAPPSASVILATCDRIEVYEGTGTPDERVVRHLFRVVSGLESPILGENQIQSQVKRAYLDAKEKFGLDSGLHRLFQQALRVGKRVRTETKLSRGALGHAQTVANLLKSLPVPLAELSLVVIGVNNLSKGILKFLAARGHRKLVLVNRTVAKAEVLAAELGAGQAVPLEALASTLVDADAVVSATSAPHTLLHPRDLPAAGGPRWFFDLAVPRDIDPDIALRPGVTVYNVTDLENEAKKSLKDRQAEVLGAEAIIDEEVVRYFAPHPAGALR
jgi:glutamyl-tRNA reductase